MISAGLHIGKLHVKQNNNDDLTNTGESGMEGLGVSTSGRALFYLRTCGVEEVPALDAVCEGGIVTRVSYSC